MNLKPLEKRRLACEQAVFRKFDTMQECVEACQEYADKKELDLTFNKNTVRHYVGCYTNLSLKRLLVLSEVLGVPDIKELDEVFTAPKHRGEGYDWEGSNGTRVKDFNINPDNKKKR